jgi:hypothetical protein
MARRCSTARATTGTAALTVLVLAGCTAEPGAESAGEASVVTGAVATVTVTAAPDPVPAGPDPAPAAPDPAPAAPDPAAPDRAGGPPMTVAAARTPSAMALACAAVEEALTDAVVRYEVQALAEDGLAGGGDRAGAAADMDAAMDRAARESGRVPGLTDAAAPVMVEVARLRDGLWVRTDLDEDDAGPWRDARDRLESWCESRD